MPSNAPLDLPVDITVHNYKNFQQSYHSRRWNADADFIKFPKVRVKKRMSAHLEDYYVMPPKGRSQAKGVGGVTPPIFIGDKMQANY